MALNLDSIAKHLEGFEPKCSREMALNTHPPWKCRGWLKHGSNVFFSKSKGSWCDMGNPFPLIINDAPPPLPNKKKYPACKTIFIIRGPLVLGGRFWRYFLFCVGLFATVVPLFRSVKSLQTHISE